jgi:hypothetical protein
MTTYYVRKTGDDDNAGTSPATAWATIGQALGASGISSGDTVYIGAGVYRECVTVGMVSATAETFVIGDVDGSKTGDAGEVIWTAFLNGDDTSPSGDATLTFDVHDHLTFERITIIAGDGATLDAWTTTSQYITFTDCAIFAMGDEWLYFQTDSNVQAHWMLDRCVLVSYIGSGMDIVSSGILDADFDLDFTFRNCLLLLSTGGSNTINVSGQAAGGYYPGGLSILNCTFVGGYNQVTVNGWSSTYPVNIYNCIFLSPRNKHISAEASGMVSQDYNYFARTDDLGCENITPGAHNKGWTDICPLLHVGQEIFAGKMLRPFLSPVDGSPLLGFGNQAGGPTVDFLNRPRPAGGGSTDNAIGYLERHDTAIREDTTADVTPGIKIVGPGDHDFMIPVDATATTISVKARYDTDHGTTNKPQAVLLTNAAIGVTAQTLTMTAAADTWETLTFTPQTPSAKGVVTVRLISRAEAATGKAFFDTFGIA